MNEPATKFAEWWAELRRRKVVRVGVVYLVGAWLVIQIAGETFEPLGLPAWTTKLVILLVALGLPLALALAWAFDVTPRGIERTGRSAPDVPSTSAAGSPPSLSATTATPPRTAGAGSLAILPFADMSPARDQDYFCEGIAEEIINALCCVRGLRIASRTSAFQFKGKTGDVRDIGRSLGVDTVLEGSVRKAGDRVRITAQLINAADGYHLWSESFDRRLEDVFAIQTEIAQQITRALRMSLTSREAAGLGRGGTANPDAYEFYLRGRALMRDHTDTTIGQAAAMYRRSIALDPEFALAYAGLADTLATIVFWHPVKDPDDIAKALDAVQRAEALQPGLAEVSVSRGLLLSAQNRRDEAVAAFDDAVARAPGLADAFYWYARHCFGAGDHRKAAELFERTVALDPTNYKAWGLLGNSYEATGQHEPALRACRRATEIIDRHLDLYPEDARALHFGASAHATLGHRERAIELGERALRLRPDEFSTLYNVACAYARLGETDRAIGLLEHAIDAGWGSVEWLEADPDLDDLRADARFVALLSRMRSGGAA